MSDREALAAALDVFTDFDGWMQAKTSPNSIEEIEVAEAMRTLAVAARERLAQLPEKCEPCNGTGQIENSIYLIPNPTINCYDCHGSGKVYPAELVERIAKALCSLGSQHPWEHSDKQWWRLMAVAVLDALNGGPG